MPTSARALAAVSIAAAALLAAAAARADESLLIRHRGHHPFTALFGLPAVAARGRGGQGWQLALEQGNNFAGGREGGETLLMDGESGELALRHRRSLGGCWQGEAIVPLMFHSGGWADRLIDDWHGYFGLPDAARGELDYFDLRYLWRDATGETRRLDDPATGLGDIHLTLQRPLACAEGASGGAVARLGVKLPSGDASRLFGSGATDAYADLLSPILRLGTRWRFAAAGGVLLAGDSELFRDQHRLVAYGSLGASLTLHPRWEALLQVDWHTPFHESELRELGAPAASLAGGLRYRLAGGQALELSVAEDAVIDTYPDIVARIAWTWNRPD